MNTRKQAEEEAAGIINGGHNSRKRLKDAILGSSHPPSTETNQCVNGLIGEIFSVNHAASHHLPYAEMICRAIEELNEEGGSSEAAISSYIKMEYRELPWAHETLLSHHLGRLCSTGMIVMSSSDGCYKLPTSKKKKNVDQLPQKEGEIVNEVNKKKRSGRPKKVKEDLVVEKKVSYGPKKSTKKEASPPCGPGGR